VLYVSSIVVLQFRILFRRRLCVLAYRCLHDTTPRYLAETIHPVCSCALLTEHISSTPPIYARRSTLGDCAFPVAATRAWNSLPPSVQNASLIGTFRRELETFCRTLLHVNAAYAVARCLSVRLSVCLVVCHIRVLYQNK